MGKRANLAGRRRTCRGMAISNQRRVHQLIHLAILRRRHMRAASHVEHDVTCTRGDDADVRSAAADGFTGAKDDVASCEREGSRKKDEKLNKLRFVM